MTCMAHHAVSPGIGHSHRAHGAGFYLLCKLVEGERKQALAQTHTTRTEPWTTLYELIPAFEYEDPKDWGSRPKFPDNSKEVTVTEIIDKWNQRLDFSLKDTALPRQGKLIDLAEALKHVDEWDVDWKDGLTNNEIKLVREHSEWFSKFAAIYFRKPRGCSCCKTLWEPGVKLLVCGGCKQIYYCGKACQADHWRKVHKKQCKLLQSRLDKDDPTSVLVKRTLEYDQIRLV